MVRKAVYTVRMQAVILAAGRGTRMGDLVKDLPKPMLKVAGETLLEHKFDALPESVDEIILVVGYLGEKIREKFGDAYKGTKLTYIEQENIAGGTADALWQAKGILRGKFPVLMGDDIYTREDITACLTHEWAILVERVPDVSVGGHIVFEGNRVTDIVEHVHTGEGLISCNLFTLDTRIFDFPQVPKGTGSTEVGLPQTILAASKVSGIPFTVVEATRWIQITNPDDIRIAEERLKKAV